MGSIKNVKITSSNKVEYTVVVDYEEDLLLKGHKTNAHVFSEEAADETSLIRCQGRGNTLYLKIPRSMAKEIRSKAEVKCLRMDSMNKIIVFAVIDK